VPRSRLEAELLQLNTSKRRSNSHRPVNETRSFMGDVTNTSIYPRTRPYETEEVTKLNSDFMKVLEQVQIGKARVYKLVNERTRPIVKQIFSELSSEIWTRVFSLNDSEVSCLIDEKRSLENKKDTCLKEFLAACKEQIEQLKSKCNGLTIENRRLSDSLKKVQSQLDSLKATGDTSAMKAELGRAEQVIKKLRNELNDNVSALYVKEEENAELKSVLKQRDRGSGGSRSSSQDRRQSVSRANSTELEELKSRLKVTESERNELSEWKAKFSQFPSEYERTIEDLKQANLLEKAHFQKKFDRFKDKLLVEHEAELLELKDQNMRVEREAEAVQEELEELQMLFHQQQDQIEEIKGAHEEEVNLLNVEKSVLLAQVEELSELCTETNKYFMEVDELKESLEGEVEELKLELMKTQTSISEEYDDKIKLLTQDLETARSRLEDRERSLHDASTHVNSMAEELKATRKRLVEVEVELKNRSVEVKSLEEGINRKVILSEELKSSSVKMEARYEELLKSAREQIKALEGKLMLKESHELENSKLRLEYSDLSDELRARSQELSAKKLEYEKLAAKIGHLQYENMKLKEDTETKDDSFNDLKSRYENLKNEYDQHVSSSQEANGQVKDCMQKLSEYKAYVDRLQTEVVSLRQNEIDLKAICAEKQALILQLRDENAEHIVNLQAAAKSEAAYRKMERQMHLQERYDSGSSSPEALRKLESEKLQLEKKCDDLGSKLVEVVSSIEFNHSNKKESAIQAEADSQEIDSLRDALNEAEILIESLRSDLEAAQVHKESYEILESQNSALMEEVQRLREGNDAWAREFKEAEWKLREAGDKIQELEITDQNKQKAIDALAAEVEIKQQGLDEVSETLCRFQEDWSNQEAELLNLKDELAEKQSKIEELSQLVEFASPKKNLKVQKFSFAEYLLANEASSMDFSRDDLKNQENQLHLRLQELLGRNEELLKENEQLKSQRSTVERVSLTRIQDSPLFSPKEFQTSESQLLLPEESQQLIDTISRLTEENSQLELTLQLQERQLRIYQDELKSGDLASLSRYKPLIIEFAGSLPELSADSEEKLKQLIDLFSLTKEEQESIKLRRNGSPVKASGLRKLLRRNKA